MTWLLALGVAMAASVSAAPANAAGVLERVSGDWSGKGTASAPDAAAPERIACRLEAVTENDPARVAISGRCSSANDAASFSIDIRRKVGATLSAVFSSSASVRRSYYSGSERGSAMTLSSTAPVKIDDATYDAVITISFSGDDTFGLSQRITHTETRASTTLFDMTFDRK